MSTHAASFARWLRENAAAGSCAAQLAQVTSGSSMVVIGSYFSCTLLCVQL